MVAWRAFVGLLVGVLSTSGCGSQAPVEDASTPPTDEPRPTDTPPADTSARDSSTPDVTLRDTPTADTATRDVPATDTVAPRDVPSMDTVAPRDVPLPDVVAPDVGGCAPGTIASQLRQSVLTVSPRRVSTGSPVMLATMPSGGAVAAWSTGTEVVLTVTDGWGARVGTDLTLTGREAMGVSVAPDGYALLVTRGSDQLFFVKVNAAGAVLAERALLSGGNHATVGTEWYGEFANTGRLVTTPTGFAAYFGLHRRWPDNIGHQGDSLRMLRADGTAAGGGWDWGCSHSLDLRLAVQGTTVGPVCLSDCYPTKGILFNHRGPVISNEPSGNCSGGSSARLGGLVAAPGGGYWVTYTSSEGRGSSDVALASLSNTGMVTARYWLTENTTAEANAHVALFEGGLLVAWEAGSTRLFARVGADGRVQGAPETISATFARQGDFVAYPGGDVGWAWGASDGLHLARVRACR